MLDSILSGMEKPPSVKKPEIKDKEKREKLEKMQRERREAAKKQKEMIEKFRTDIKEKIRAFVNTPTTDDISTTKFELKPMGKIYRSIVYEACEEFEDEIIAHSFGTEEVDRHCIIWRKGYEPCEEEIRALKLGVEYNPNSGEKAEDDETEPGLSEGKTETGKDKFWARYEKIIGENASGLESARVAIPANQYGCVPIDNKKDQRSIEQMMDDIRKSKKQKTTDTKTEETSENSSVSP